MNYKELCEKLNNNNEQKDVFFRNVKAPDFLPYFEKYNVLTFDNNAGASVIKYLIHLVTVDKSLKKNISQIINKNIAIYKKMSGYVFEAMLNLLKEFSISEIEDLIDADTLLRMDNAYLFCEFLLKNDISDTNHLYKKCIETLINYKVYEDPVWKTKSAASIHGPYIYQIKDLFSTLPYKENLKKILCKKDLFDILIKQYEKIYNEIGELNYIDRQYIKALEPILGEKVESYDVRNLLIDYISVNLENNNTQNTVVNLLHSKAQMLNKLGLYAILLDKKQFENLFVEFFNNFEIDYIPFYIYELMSILEDNTFNLRIGNAIYNRVMSFDKILKYRFLHVLKNNPLFKDEFLILKKEYKNEIDNPKIIFFINKVDVHSVPPIMEETFLKKSIAQQIKYINNYKTSIIQNVEITKNTIKSEFELYNIFKKALDNNLDKYLFDVEMYKLNKSGAIISFFETIEKACMQNKTFDIQCVIKLLKIYLNQKNDNDVFNYNCTKMLLQLIQKTNSQADLASIFEIVENQIKLWKNAMFDEITSELPYSNSICPLGQYLKVWFSCWTKNKDNFKDKKQFLYNNFDQKDNLPNQLLYYNLGQYYDLLNDVCKIKIENIESQLLKEAFIEGVINNNKTNLYLWKTYTNYIIEYIKKLNKNENNMNWQNFLYSLIHIKFEFNNDELFQSLYKSMNSEQKTDFVWNTLFPSRNPKYDKHSILKYWEKEIHSAKTAKTQVLLMMFNEYAENADFENNLLNLKKLFTKFEFEKNNSLNHFLELEDFLTKLDLYIKNLNKSNEEHFNKIKKEIFEMLKVFIPVFSKYEYISIQESNLLKVVLEDYINQLQANDNVKILKEIIYNTPNLIQYSDIF